MELGTKRGVLVGTLVATMSVGGPARGQDDWPMHQGNPEHTGHVPVALDPDKIAVHWEVDLGQYGLSPVVAADGYVFVSESGWDGDKLYALHKETGAVLWEHDFDDPFSVNPPSYADGRVYVQTCNHGNDTWVWAFDADTGALAFQTGTAAQWERYLAPTVYDGSVYVNGGYYGGMYGVDGSSGAQLWWIGLAQYDEWTPAVDDQYCYAYVGGTLSVVDRFSGALAYSIPDPDFDWMGWSMLHAPILGGMDDLIAINGSTASGRLISFDLDAQDIRYVIDELVYGEPAVRNGALYLINGGSLDVRDQVDGTPLWDWTPANGQLRGNVVVTETHAVVHTSAETHLIDLVTRQSVWSWPASGHVSLAEANLFIAQADGTLTALAYVASPQPLSISPKSTKYYEELPSVTVTGTGFSNGTTTQVLFGGSPATDVVVVDDQTIRCKAPLSGPGQMPVMVQNDVGSGVLQGSFSYTPALSHTGDVEPDETIVLSFEIAPNDALIALLGRGVATGHAVAPWYGTLNLIKPKVLFSAPSWPFATFDLSIDIPDDPSLVGLAFSVQGLAGKLASEAGAWTNVETLVIQ